ncbi:hypothetical protein ACN20G_07310 [Streptomyces sp. BI20]|uniref:hypothetical protein n=1 Tax=Streptomyces sp. BI20 TaxID=3403460 RepID=UPI003C76E41B
MTAFRRAECGASFFVARDLAGAALDRPCALAPGHLGPHMRHVCEHPTPGGAAVWFVWNAVIGVTRVLPYCSSTSGHTGSACLYPEGHGSPHTWGSSGVDRA